MTDDDSTLPLPEGSSPMPGASGLRGLTAALGLEPAHADRDPLLGCDIGGVTIVRAIGEGGMGRVYEGKQEKPGRTVAVKIMRPGLTSPSFLKRFEHEAEVLARLQHPGIAHIYSVGVHRLGNASVPYFVMEYIADARPLTAYAADLKLPIRQRLDLFRSVCDAVAHGHQKGVIHRDLKPSNILVDSSGQPKVIDFGIARVTDSDLALTTMQTDVGDMIGTLQYMSPEQFDANPQEIDVRSDVYALGVVLYELLADKPPYDVREKAIYEVMRIVREEDPTPLSAFDRSLRGDVAVIAGKCLEKNRGRRYSSAGELGSDIARYLSGEPISARPPSFVDGVVRLARRHRAAAAAVASVFLALVTATVGIGIFAGRAEEARQRAERERGVAEQARVTAEESRQEAQAAETRAQQEVVAANQRRYEANCYRIQQLIKRRSYDLARTLIQEQRKDLGLPGFPVELNCFEAACDQAIVTFRGHKSPIQNLAFSPDGTRLAMEEEDHASRLWDTVTGKQIALLEGAWFALSPDGTRLATLRKDVDRGDLWDAETGNRLAVLEGNKGSITTLQFSPDGALLATGGEKGEILLWNAKTGDVLRALDGHDGGFSDLAFSSDGTRLATDSIGNTRLWDPMTGKQIALLEGKGFAFSPDGTRLVTVAKDHPTRYLWDAETGNRLAVLEGNKGSITTLQFSPDGALLATGGEKGEILLWNAETGNLLRTVSWPEPEPQDPFGFEPHQWPIDRIVFSPDGTRFVTMTVAVHAHLWDSVTGIGVAALRNEENQCIDNMQFSPDSVRLATTFSDGSVGLWDAVRGDQQLVLEGHAGGTGQLAFSPDGTRLATWGKWRDNAGKVFLWDAATGNHLAVFESHESQINELAFSPDGTRLATASADFTARLWNATTERLPSGSLAFSPDGTRFATAISSTVRMWDAITHAELAVLKGHEKRITEIIFSPDGSQLATASEDATARLWDAHTGRQSAVLEGHEHPVLAVAFSPDGARLATGSGDKTARLWDAVTAEQLTVLRGHDDSVRAVAFSPDGTRLATGAFGENANLWDGFNGKHVAVLEGNPDAGNILSNPFGPKGVTGLCRGGRFFVGEVRIPRYPLAFSPDGMRLATGGQADNTVRLWDAKSGSPLAVLEGHQYPITNLAFSPDGTRLAAEAGWIVRLWDAESRESLALLEGHKDSITNMAFSPDGTRLATLSDDTTVQLWSTWTGSPLATFEGKDNSLVFDTLAFSPDGVQLAVGFTEEIQLCGVSNADLYQARRQTAAIERRLKDRVATWLKDGPDSAVAQLRAAKTELSEDEYRIAGNMILKASCRGDEAK